MIPQRQSAIIRRMVSSLEGFCLKGGMARPRSIVVAMNHFVIRDRFVALRLGVVATSHLEVRLPCGFGIHAEGGNHLFQVLALAGRAHGSGARIANQRLKLLSALPALEIVQRHDGFGYSRSPKVNIQWPAAIETYCLPSTW